MQQNVEKTMCGRYSLTHTAQDIGARFEVEAPADFSPRYNVAPTQEMPVVRAADSGARRCDALRWGLIPFWADDEKIGNRMINARSETAAQKPSFRAAFRRRRCLVVADGFYEWVEKDGDKWPLRITLGGGDLGAFAGLWERWSKDDGRVVESYTILTAAAAPELESLHDRMPVWAPEDCWEAWLFDDDGAQKVLEAMLEAFPGASVGYYPVSRELNRPGNDEPKLIEPAEVEGLPRRGGEFSA